MARDALLVVENFLHAGNLQVRRNAVAALAAIGSVESIERLVEVAAGDERGGRPHADSERDAVRLQAEEELVALLRDGGDGAAHVQSVLDARFAQPATQLSTYLLL